MKIIKHGTVNRVVICRCGCEFEYDIRDVHHKKDNNNSSLTTYAYVICPDCGAMIFLGTSNNFFQRVN